MKVIATKTGFDGKRVRNAGDEFDMPEGSKGSWFAQVKKADGKAQTQKADGKAQTQKADGKADKEPVEPGKDLV